MRCIQDIGQDEGIFDSYVDLLEPTFERQQVLLQSKHFLCRCQRCLDPTECGRYISSFRCPSCPSGWVSPIISYNEKDNVLGRLWRCLDCKQEQNDMIIAILKDIDALKQFLLKKSWSENTAEYMESAKQFEKTLSLLHNNHVLRLQYHLGMTNCLDTMENFKEAIVHCMAVKRIVKAILRVQSGERVECYELMADLYEKFFLQQLGSRMPDAGVDGAASPAPVDKDESVSISTNRAIRDNLEHSNRYLQKALDTSKVCYGEDDENTLLIKDQIKKLTVPAKSATGSN
ncbi:hypothetical protein SAMD00019534_100900 [Acytostelium subglobosum LB1]|uniref:hypothetical protein n=1 Tax=Acytostelium subglobosum LB1 TaxID=1410327 RepID=UPI000644C5CC|nr:hypothetical protein SAMD00019534_100900 [Acytostelium subglobosum LB1]GAM26915.1 hypothetical protein SAMD00019534_100900 [Acytostelium subglobosum LB1]|eukprot:XP_012750183.1 hypothetical protein SAMD00019534_100900 [Acytostelium subglobosum LB1]